MADYNWHALSQDKILGIQKTSLNGLDIKEVKDRQRRFGLNQLPTKKKLNSLVVFLNQFKNPLIYILVVAAVVSFILGHQVDSGVILAAVVVNTLVGWLQENKAKNALLKLSQAVVVKARVRRAGVEQELEAKELVPGDIVVLEAGDKIPADCRLLAAKNVLLNEAALTGESWEVEKVSKVLDKDTSLADRLNMLYMGTVMTAGKVEAVVVSTGLATEIGRIASLLKTIEEDSTPLQQRLGKLSKQIGVAVLAIALFILVFGVWHDYPFFTMFEMAVAVAVSAIPEGMIVALTVVLAIGMQKILKHQGLVKKLAAAEALGSTTVICTDKTGTLTSGEMRVTEIITNDWHFDTLDNISIEQAKQGWDNIIDVLQIGVLCNEAVIEHQTASLKHVKIFGNMTERALLMAGLNFGLHRDALLKDSPQLDILPFDSSKKYMATLHKVKGREVMYIKGAPEKIIDRASFFLSHHKKKELKDKKKEELVNKFEKLSRQGLRILAVAYKKMEAGSKIIKEEDISDLIFVGFIGMKDPIREGVKEAIQVCFDAGLKVVMITGDHKLTAKTIAKEVGLDVDKASVVTGDYLKDLTDKDFYDQVGGISVYARANPADKLRIIEAWQQQNEVVAMTGDGVNDAPALTKANIGVAMGSGTEVAKGAADLVILDDHFSTIVAAIQEGRVIYDNIKKVILYLMSDSLAEVIIILFALIIGWPLPLLATQILWINIVDDGLPGMALTLDPGDPHVMKEKPTKITKGVLNTEHKLLILLISLITAVSTLAIFYYFWKTTGNEALARTAAFTGLAISTLMYVFSCRSLRHDFIDSIKIKNWYLVGSVLIGLSLQLLAVYMPFFQNVFHTVSLGLREWVAIILQGFLIIAVVEFVKGLYLVRFRQVKAEVKAESVSHEKHD